MEFKVQYMWAQGVFSEDKLYMVIILQRVLNDQKW